MSLHPRTVRALEHRLATEQSTRRLPSLSAALVRDGRRVWSFAVGHVGGRAGTPEATTDTQYRIGSLTKTFVAVQVARLRDEGRLDLGDAIGTHLPELDLPVSIAQLLSHTSGLQAETAGPWWERTPGDDWPALLASRPALVFTPGTRFHYSNVGFGVLGELVARLRGAPWPEVLQREVLDPLGMHRTTFGPRAPSAPGLAVHPFADLQHVEPDHDARAMAPAGQLWSTADDLARWAAFAAGHTADVLDPESLKECQRPVALWDDPTNAWATAHALGWQVSTAEGRRFVGHGGSMPGFLAGLRVDAESGDGVVVLANATSGMGPVAADLLTLLREQEPTTPRPWTARPAQADDLDLVGDWFWGTARFTLTLRDDQLALGEPGTGRGARFERTPGGWRGLTGYYSGETLTVRRDESGRPVQLDLASFVLTRTPYDTAADVPGGLDPRGWAGTGDLWQEYVAAHPQHADEVPARGPFGDSPELADSLLGLVLAGPKRATCGLPDPDEPVFVGGHWVVQDGRGVERLVLRTTEVRRGPLSSGDDAFAADEAEGDLSRGYWLGTHRTYFRRALDLPEDADVDDVEVVFERFTVVWPLDLAD